MRRIIVGFILFILFLAQNCFAQGQGLTGRLLVKSNYFDVYADDEIDPYQLLTKINYEYLLHGLQWKSLDKETTFGGETIELVLAQMLDGLYEEVADILDIHLANFHSTVVFFKDRVSLTDFLWQQYNLVLDQRSIYYHQDNIIYASFDQLNKGLLGRQIASAILTQYLGVPAPSLIEDVLCSVVESTLLKSQ
ncbi:MAG: hypothetical protein N2606_04900 [Candidatus Omnitrophica bacterium]|nr:hypothetical protein [Candidatus Omnitrophota bacterium]